MIHKLNPKNARGHLQAFAFADLFIEDLGWNHPDARKAIPVKIEGITYHATEISQLSGFRVFEVIPADADTPFPDAKTQQALWKAIAPHAVENILIFLDPSRVRSVWLWMKRDGGKTFTRRHHYLAGQPGDLFLSKLSSLFVDLSELDEDGNIPITETAARVRNGLDIEQVTKAFFKDFQEEHSKLLDSIGGIPDPRERRWYASVLLNRLMFIWFLQAKAFLDGGNRQYLTEKLEASEKSGPNLFFKSFLRDLFFEGFAKPEEKRKPLGKIPLGDIPYLNGGLFLPHGIETRIEGDGLHTAPYSTITVPDSCFTDLFALFSRYSWSLNDTPGGDDREINPDVLGYIFEKYINQKEFGAYYTRPEITDYLCEQTIHQLVLDRVNAGFAPKHALHKADPKNFPAPRRYESIEDLLLHATGSICQTVLQDILPKLSLLDPACGSGAFLVAAQKTLLNLYTALIGRCEALAHKPVLQWRDTEKKKHKAPIAYWLKKKIVTENLFGVDLMEEATEIAKLRLFLSLVASAEKRDQLEPLPNIEFNLLPGNSLIGLLHVDPAAFDSNSTTPGKTKGKAQDLMTLAYEETLGFTTQTTHAPTTREKQQAHIATKQAAQYTELLRKKNHLIHTYQESTATFKDLASLKRDIDLLKQEARAILDKLLLEQFHALGIQYHQATWDTAKKKEGKPEKRPLRIADIEALQPFHWAYEFDEIIVNRGGIDAIITNPPWEVFEKSDKEFFRHYENSITKNKLRLEDWIEQRDVILEQEDVRADWLEYLSGFPHQAKWFKESPYYQNQTTVINGKIAASKNDLYKVFLEQTVNLLAPDGRCGAVIPGSIYNNRGAAQLRRMLFDETVVTSMVGFENNKAIFEGVHRSFKFFVLTFKRGDSTDTFPAAFMRHLVGDLSGFPENHSVQISYESLKKASPDTVALLEFRSDTDSRIFLKLTAAPTWRPPNSDHTHASLHYEFNLTNDLPALFVNTPEAETLPLIEGKAFHQFNHRWSKPRYWVREKKARLKLKQSRIRSIKKLIVEHKLDIDPETLELDLGCDSYRIAFRDVARNTDERTMISTILPPNVFCPHTVALERVYEPFVDNQGVLHPDFSPLNDHSRCLLVAFFDSFVLDYMVRLQVTAHLSFFYIYNLSIPRLTEKDPDFRPLVERAARLTGTAPEFDDLLAEIFGKGATHKTHGVTEPQARLTLRAQIDALVARLYHLTVEEFQHILTTFPLVDESVKSQTFNAYRELVKLGKFA